MRRSGALRRMRRDVGAGRSGRGVGRRTGRPHGPSDDLRRQALFVVNLEPRRMMGEVSEGMLFDLGSADGILPALAVPEREVPNGTRAG